MTTSQTAMPAMRLGQNILGDTLKDTTVIGDQTRVVIIADAFLTDQPVFHQALACLSTRGISTEVFSGFAGEPKAAHVDAAVQMAQAHQADTVIGIGGGSALDIAKLVSVCLHSGMPVMHYALAANPMPASRKTLVQVPTTAGTGSEANGTAIFAGPDGAKLWAFGTVMKPDLAVLDAELLASLPAHLKTWTGLDAFIHAFEAATNRWSNPVNLGYATRALQLVANALPAAIQGDAQANQDLMLGSFLAGFAIENTGTSIAHCASHAMASFAPIHHGLATALAFEVTLCRVVSADNPNLPPVAQALGTTVDDLHGWITAFFTAAGLNRQLPAQFSSFSAHDLAREMQTDTNAPMRNASLLDTSAPALEAMASDILNLAA